MWGHAVVRRWAGHCRHCIGGKKIEARKVELVGANVRSNVDDLATLEPTEEDKLTMMCNRAFSAEQLAEQNNALLNAATSRFVTDELIEQTRAAMAAWHTSYQIALRLKP